MEASLRGGLEQAALQSEHGRLREVDKEWGLPSGEWVCVRGCVCEGVCARM